MKPEFEIPAYRICSTCDEVVTDPHVHNVWRFYHPLLIQQGSVTGLDLTPVTLCVLGYANWIDSGLREIYNPRRPYRPSVGLS